MLASEIEPQSEEVRLERLTFHLQTGDYFRVLATVLGFVQETVTECTCTVESDLGPLETRVISSVRADLDYLHNNYRIVRIDESAA
jgi:hypothetical protein